MSLPASRHRIPPEITLELGSSKSDFMPKISQVIGKAVAASVNDDGDPAEWLRNLQWYLAEGDPMIVNARMGRTLVGFLVLDYSNAASPFSWVDERYRNKGLGPRIPFPAGYAWRIWVRFEANRRDAGAAECLLRPA